MSFWGNSLHYKKSHHLLKNKLRKKTTNYPTSSIINHHHPTPSTTSPNQKGQGVEEKMRNTQQTLQEWPWWLVLAGWWLVDKILFFVLVSPHPSAPIWKIGLSNWIMKPKVGVKIKKICELPPPRWVFFYSTQKKQENYLKICSEPCENLLKTKNKRFFGNSSFVWN